MARILVIDDEAMVRLAVGAALRFAGHEVVDASDGETGIALIQQQAFDLIVTDIRLPRLDGQEVIKASRRIQPGCRVIAVGGGGTVAVFGPEAYARQLGADRVLHKPFAVHELNAAVAELLNIAQGG